MAEDSEPDYEYRGLLAQARDLLRAATSTWTDRSFCLMLSNTMTDRLLTNAQT